VQDALERRLTGARRAAQRADVEQQLAPDQGSA
jgi:hypothetical protein